jgi:hypothetical protein
MKHTSIPLLLAILFVAPTAQSQPGPPRARFDVQREIALAQPFKGIFYLDIPPANLFPIKKTGVSTEPVRQAAKAFLASLGAADRKKTIFPVDDIEWRKWDNRHFFVRQGTGFDKMTKGQRALAFNLMKASLSARGLRQTRDIMKLNGTLAELTRKPDEYGEWLYWITIMGEPSATKPWGWQLGSTRARDTLRDLLAQPQGTPALDVLAQLEATGWLMEYDHFCGWQTDGQLYQRAPLPEEELEDDIKFLLGATDVGAALVVAHEVDQALQQAKNCGFSNKEIIVTVTTTVAGTVVIRKIFKKIGNRNTGARGPPKRSTDQTGYSSVQDHPSVAPGKRFTSSQKKKFISKNRKQNDGKIRSDFSGQELTQPNKHKRGVTPPDNEAHTDHIVPRSKGDSNSSSNAQV